VIHNDVSKKRDILTQKWSTFPSVCLPSFFLRGEVPITAYSHPYINEIESGVAHGCSPWGTSTIAGAKGERVPTEGELEVAVHQGKVSAPFIFGNWTLT
jgi:hypothetical protein